MKEREFVGQFVLAHVRAGKFDLSSMHSDRCINDLISSALRSYDNIICNTRQG